MPLALNLHLLCDPPNMRSAHFILFLTLQMQVFGINFKSRLAKQFDSNRPREMSLTDLQDDRSSEYPSTAEILGNVTEENANQHFRISLHERAKVSNPSVNLAHRSPSTNAKGFWNQFMFRGKSDFRYVLPIRDIEVRQEKCRPLTFSQRVLHENCETLELQNNVCFGKCDTPPSSGEGGLLPCAVCTPVLITPKTVKLKCTGNTEITKVVKIIEDCECKIKEGIQSHHNGPVLVDPNIHQ